MIADEERVVWRQQPFIEDREGSFDGGRLEHDQRPLLRKGDQLARSVLEWQGDAPLTAGDRFEGTVGEDSASAQCGRCRRNVRRVCIRSTYTFCRDGLPRRPDPS